MIRRYVVDRWNMLGTELRGRYRKLVWEKTSWTIYRWNFFREKASWIIHGTSSGENFVEHRMEPFKERILQRWKEITCYDLEVSNDFGGGHGYNPKFC